MDSERLAQCEKALGHQFDNLDLLRSALTHSSAKIEANGSNERMEFLGDAILGMTVSEYLYKELPDQSEGVLTKIKSVVVSQRTLARISNDLGLRNFLRVGRGIADREKMPHSLLANAFEAVVAAIYLDAGLERAREFIIGQLAEDIESVRHNQHERNYKSILQQFSQQHLGATPMYRVVKEEGPDHVKMFHIVTVIQGQSHGSGWGRSKKQAEQRAAKESLEVLYAHLAEGGENGAAGEQDAIDQRGGEQGAHEQKIAGGKSNRVEAGDGDADE